MLVLSLATIVAAIAALIFAITPVVRWYVRYRGTRLVTCPETKAPAAVEVDALHFAFSDDIAKKLRLKECSRWPERENCGQECLRQIEAAPEDCTVRTIVTKWYDDKNCALCGKAIGKIDWREHKPGVLGPERKTALWSDFRPEMLPEVMATHQPICWDCHSGR
jgi:hypothetical protein